jgi:hypothetical protein
VTKEKEKASVHPALNTHDTQPSSEVEDSRTINKLRSLKQLKDEGILTEDEFEQRRKALVDYTLKSERPEINRMNKLAWHREV